MRTRESFLGKSILSTLILSTKKVLGHFVEEFFWVLTRFLLQPIARKQAIQMMSQNLRLSYSICFPKIFMHILTIVFQGCCWRSWNLWKWWRREDYTKEVDPSSRLQQGSIFEQWFCHHQDGHPRQVQVGGLPHLSALRIRELWQQECHCLRLGNSLNWGKTANHPAKGVYKYEIVKPWSKSKSMPLSRYAFKHFCSLPIVNWRLVHGAT